MINIKKGPAHSLLQTDTVVPVDPAVAVTAGMVVRKDVTSGKLALGGAATDLMGFALGSTTDSDVIAAGKLGMLYLDAATILETDQVLETINATNFPDGTPIYAQTGNTGKVTANNTVSKVLGYACGVRNLVGLPITVNGVKIQGSVTVLAIKLAA